MGSPNLRRPGEGNDTRRKGRDSFLRERERERVVKFLESRPVSHRGERVLSNLESRGNETTARDVTPWSAHESSKTAAETANTKRRLTKSARGWAGRFDRFTAATRQNRGYPPPGVRSIVPRQWGSDWSSRWSQRHSPASPIAVGSPRRRPPCVDVCSYRRSFAVWPSKGGGKDVTRSHEWECPCLMARRSEPPSNFTTTVQFWRYIQ